MGEALNRGGGDVEWPQHTGRKLVEDGRLQSCDGGEAWMVIGRMCGKVDARAPGFVQRVSRRVDHTGQRLDALQFAHRRGGQGRLDGRAQTLAIDRADKTAGQPDGGLLEGHDLEAVPAGAPRRKAALPHGEAAVNDQGGSMGDGHGRPPSGFCSGLCAAPEIRSIKPCRCTLCIDGCDR